MIFLQFWKELLNLTLFLDCGAAVGYNIVEKTTGKEDNGMKYVCNVCGYIYDPAEGDPDNGIEAGTAFEALPEDWVCPLCGVGKDDFSPEE